MASIAPRRSTTATGDRIPFTVQTSEWWGSREIWRDVRLPESGCRFPNTTESATRREALEVRLKHLLKLIFSQSFFVFTVLMNTGLHGEGYLLEREVKFYLAWEKCIDDNQSSLCKIQLCFFMTLCLVAKVDLFDIMTSFCLAHNVINKMFLGDVMM